MPDDEWNRGYYNSIRKRVDEIWWDGLSWDFMNESLLRELFIFYKRDAHKHFRKIQYLITPDFLREIKDQCEIRWVFYEWWREYLSPSLYYGYKKKIVRDVTFEQFCKQILPKYKDIWNDWIKNNDYIL